MHGPNTLLHPVYINIGSISSISTQARIYYLYQISYHNKADPKVRFSEGLQHHYNLQAFLEST